MLYLICGDAVRIGKTALMTYLAILNALDRSKNEIRAEKVRELRARGFSVSRSKFALYANYNIKRELFNDELTSILLQNDDLLKVARIGDDAAIYLRPYSTLCVMEAQGVFNAREWQQFTKDQALYFQTSGHYGVDIFLDTQDAENIEKTLRQLCKVIYVHERRIYNEKGKQVEIADKYDLSRIEWDITFYERYKQYEKEIDGIKQKICCDFNIYDCYNPYENYENYLPKNKSNLII